MRCPMTFGWINWNVDERGFAYEACQGDGCAWWVPDGKASEPGKCALVVLAVATDDIASSQDPVNPIYKQ